MRTRITIALVAANLVLFGFILFLNHSGHPDRAARENTRKIFGPEATNLDYLEIRLGDNEPRVLRLEAGKWNIKAPLNWPANFFAVNRILQQLEFLEKKTSFRTSDLGRNSQDLAHYGLEDPQAVLIFGRGSQRHEIRVGAPTDIGNRLYILDPSGEWIHVVHSEFAQTLSVQLNELQSETIFHIPLFEVRSLNLQLGSHSKIRLARDENRWAFETPFQTRADAKAVESVVGRLNGLRISRFEPNANASEIGLENPRMRITLDGNSRRETLLVGNPVPGASGRSFAKLADNPTIFTLNTEPLQILENAQDLLRDRKLLQFDRAEISSINVKASGSGEVLLQKLETGDWQIVSRYADQSVRILPADTQLIERLLTVLDETYVLRFENDAPSDGDLIRFGFDEPQRVITLGGTGGVTLLLGGHVPDSQGTAVYAKLERSRFVHTVDASILREIPSSTEHFRDRLLLPQPAGSTITSIRIRDLKTRDVVFETALPSGESDWQTAIAPLSESEQKAVLALLPELRNLRVDRYIGDDFSPIIEMNGRAIEFSYRLEADLLLVGGESPRRSSLDLLLTNRLGGQTVLGGSRQLNVVFSLRQDLIDALTPLLFERPKNEPQKEPASEDVTLSSNND